MIPNEDDLSKALRPSQRFDRLPLATLLLSISAVVFVWLIDRSSLPIPPNWLLTGGMATGLLLTLMAQSYANKKQLIIQQIHQLHLQSLKDKAQIREDNLKLKASEDQLLALLDVSPIAIRIAVDGGYRVVFHNPSYARLVNNTQVTGEDPSQYYSDPGEYHRVLEELTKVHQVINRQMRLRIPGSSDVWVLASYMPTEYRGQPAILGWFYDITPVQTALREISQREQEFHRLIDHLPYGVLIHQSGIIQFYNRSAIRLLGLNHADELIGKSVLEIVHPDFRPIVITRIGTLTEVEEEIPPIEEKLLRHDGTIFDAEVSGIRIYHEGKPASMIVFHDITRLKNHENELKRIAHFDSLTGLPNRALLYDRMSQAFAVNSRHHTLLVICYLDIDGFKQINDSHGHEAGDQVLIEMARRMTATLRDGDTVARLGGDEFVILLSGYQREDESLVTLHRLLDQINEPIQLSSDLKVSLSASMGISLFPRDDHDPDILLRHADQAMYLAKQSGKNQIEIYKLPP